ncbi:MAG: hypothetical protein H7178_08615 [Chitinophagaceae bacterium]|nr:hypothetical protein [Chitinophagaceae bacterium]
MFKSNSIFGDKVIDRKYRVAAILFMIIGLLFSVLLMFNIWFLIPKSLQLMGYIAVMAACAIFLRLEWLYKNKKEKLMPKL